MKRKLAETIVKGRYVIMTVMLLLAVLSLFTIGWTKINYDLTKYLDEDTMTQRALKVMEEEFGSSEQPDTCFCSVWKHIT